MVSNSYLPRLSDDSQNNFSWDRETGKLDGRWIGGKTRACLDVIKFELVVEHEGQINRLPLNGLTVEEISHNLRGHLDDVKLDGDQLLPITQFEIPSHAVDRGAPFEKPDEADLEQWARWLSNAEGMLEYVAPIFPWASQIRIWPHHFDMGLFIPITRGNNATDLQSISLGLAIGDDEVDVPYFYINHWSKDSISYPATNPSIRTGYWHDSGWKGFVLSARNILATPSDQQEVEVKKFIQDGISATLNIMGKSPKIIFQV
jgi:hypothetical protein